MTTVGIILGVYAVLGLIDSKRAGEAIAMMASDSLSVASEFYKEGGRQFPAPSNSKNGDVIIEFCGVSDD